jgi:hypothetical protein
MQQQRRKCLKRCVHWLLEPWIIGTDVILLLSTVPILLWLASDDSAMADWMFVITYLSPFFTPVEPFTSWAAPIF